MMLGTFSQTALTYIYWITPKEQIRIPAINQIVIAGTNRMLRTCLLKDNFHYQTYNQ